MKKEIKVKLAILVLVMADYLMFSVASQWTIFRPLSDTQYYSVMVGTLVIIAVLAGVLFVKSGKSKEYGAVRFRWSYLVALLLSFLALFIWNVLTSALFPTTQNTAMAQEYTRDFTGFTWLLMTVMYPAVLAPILEEILFRGLVMTSLSAYRRFGLDLVLSATLFSLGHILQFGWVLTDFITYLGSGLILGILFRYTRSLAWSILAHILWNAFIIIVRIMVFGS